LVVQVVSSPSLITTGGGFFKQKYNIMGSLNYRRYNDRVKRFLKYLDLRPWQIDTISDQEDEKIRAEF